MGEELESRVDDSMSFCERLTRIAKGDFVFSLLVAVISRISIFGMSWLFNVNFGPGRSFQELLCSWDCGWYLSVIVDGYHLQPQGHASGDAANWAFFPLFPLSARVLSSLTGLSGLTSAVVISNAAFIAALPILFTYVKTTLGTHSARFVIMTLAFSPYSLYFSAPYTESLYLLLMIGTLHLAKSNRWLMAGVLAAMLSATRNAGVLLVFPLLLIAVHQYGVKRLLTFSDGWEKVLFCLFVAPLGLFVYMHYLHQHVGDALAFKNVQVAWGRGMENPFSILTRSWGGMAYEKYCVMVACVSLVAGLYLLWERCFVEGLILLMGILIPLTTGIASIPRYAFTLFPVYVVLALMTRGRPRFRYVLLCCLVQLTGFTIMSWLASEEFMT